MEKTKENWRAIKGTSGKYKISDLGNVIGVSGKILKPTKMKIGYEKISISLNGKVQQEYVHKLVASHFLSQKDADEVVINHKDGNKCNNSVTNLEFVSRIENAKHWAQKNRSPSAGRKKSAYCKRGHKFVDGRTYCLECRRLKMSGVSFTPPKNCNWKRIPKTNYLVSDTGLVWSNKSEIVLSPGTDMPGYKFVVLRINGKNKRYSIHRLVFEAFVGRIEDGFVIDHINSDKSDNGVQNLRMLSRSENTLSAKDKIRDEKTHGFKFSEEQISEIKWFALNSNLLQSDLIKHFGISQSFLSSIIREKSWKHIRPIEPKHQDISLKELSALRKKESKNIAEIKWLVKNTNIFQKDIAKYYEIEMKSVSSIKVGRNYSDVKPVKPKNLDDFLKNSLALRSRESRKISEIKWLLENTSIPQKDIAEQYKLSKGQVSSIKTGRTQGQVKAIKPDKYLS